MIEVLDSRGGGSVTGWGVGWEGGWEHLGNFLLSPGTKINILK